MARRSGMTCGEHSRLVYRLSVGKRMLRLGLDLVGFASATQISTWPRMNHLLTEGRGCLDILSRAARAVVASGK
jgi:hypothetical protein